MVHLASLTIDRVTETNFDHRGLIYQNLEFLTSKHGLELHRGFNLCEDVDRLAGADEGAKGSLHLSPLAFDNLVDAVSIPELHGVDLHRILIHLQIGAQLEAVLVADNCTGASTGGVFRHCQRLDRLLWKYCCLWYVTLAQLARLRRYRVLLRECQLLCENLL